MKISKSPNLFSLQINRKWQKEIINVYSPHTSIQFRKRKKENAFNVFGRQKDLNK